MTVVMEDARHLSSVIEAVFLIRSLERIGDRFAAAGILPVCSGIAAACGTVPGP
ncbi:MAG: hypothetical protein U1F14_11430 [Steroidobacteraceae bacterium]